LVLHYLNDILCKNYNYMFVFAKVIPKTLLVPFFPGTVYMAIYGETVNTIITIQKRFGQKRQSFLSFPRRHAKSAPHYRQLAVVVDEVRNIFASPDFVGSGVIVFPQVDAKIFEKCTQGRHRNFCL